MDKGSQLDAVRLAASTVDAEISISTRRRYDIAALILCIASVFLALWIGNMREVPNFSVENDFVGNYAPQAENIRTGLPYTYRLNPPGYEILLVGFNFITGDFFIAGKIISAIAAGLMVLLTYGIVRALFDPRVAMATTLLVSAVIIPYSFMAATDLVGGAAMLFPVWLYLNRSSLSWKTYFLIGIGTGLAYLIRSNAITVVLGIAFSILVINVYEESLNTRIKWLGVFSAGLLITISPWLYVNWKVNGSPFSNTAYLAIAANAYYKDISYSYSQTGMAVQRASQEFKSLKDVIFHDPYFFFQRYFRAILFDNVKFLAIRGLGFPAFLFMGGGILLYLGDLNRKRLAYLLVAALGYGLLGLMGFHLRYYVFMIPLLLLFVSWSLFHPHTLRLIGRYTKVPSLAAWFIVMLMAVLFVRGSYAKTVHILETEPKYLVEIAEFLKERSMGGEIIAGPQQQLAYLAGLEGLSVDGDSAQEFADNAHKIGARYIFFNGRDAKKYPNLKGLADPDANLSGWKSIYRHLPSNTIIYEFRGQKEAKKASMQ